MDPIKEKDEHQLISANFVIPGGMEILGRDKPKLTKKQQKIRKQKRKVFKETRRRNRNN
jgi:hypothetical protein